MKTYHDVKKTHRCKQSVARGISIHYCNPYKYISAPECGDFRWWLLKDDYDFDYDSHYLQPITPIEYCPCCGQRLEEFYEA